MMIEEATVELAQPIGYRAPVLLDAARVTAVALLVVDRQCRIVQANEATQTLAQTEVTGKQFCEAFSAERCGDAPGSTCMISHALRGIERRTNPRWITLQAAGAACSVLFKATSLYSHEVPAAEEDILPSGAAVTIIPSRLVDDADHRRREMIAATVHDLRHPITIQSIALELLEAQTAGTLSVESRALLVKLRRATTYLTSTVDDLLSRMLFDLQAISIHPQSLALAELSEAIAWQLQPMLDRRRQTVKIDVPAKVRVYVDPVAIEHMLVNLILNAHKYSVDGDQIVISVRVRPQTKTTEISVRDHGPGVAAQERRRVFDRFFRGDTATQQRGVGLGLSIVASLAAQHGGRVGVRAARGGGAQFWILLPDSATPTDGVES